MDRFPAEFRTRAESSLHFEGVTVSEEDKVESFVQEFVQRAMQAQEQGPPAKCVGFLNPPFLTRLGYIQFYETTMAQTNAQHETGHQQAYHKQTMRSYLHHNKAPTSILSLRATTLREVARRVNYIHEDKILFLKTTYDACRIIGMNVLVEDDQGDCIMLSLYNYLASHENPSDFFPVGTYMALLAPLMKHAQDDPSKGLILRCDNPDCVRVFPFYRSWIAAKHGKKMLADVHDDPDVLRKVGNDHFAEKQFETAAQMYSRALACSKTISEPTRIACLCNRAEVKLRLECWEAAEMDARAVLMLDDSHVKARFCLTHALLHLNRITEASELVSKLQGETELKKNKAFAKLVREVNQAYDEQCNGNYNYVQMMEEVSHHGITSFHASYTSPKIEQNVTCVKHSGFSYRGSIARETLDRNTLVSASKAFAFVAPPRNSLSMGINPYTQSLADTSRLELENNIIVLLHRRPKLKEVFYALSSGAPDDSLSCGGTGKCKMRIDMDRIARIISTNSFAAHSDESLRRAIMLDPRQSKASAQFLSGSGLWINESRFNHSCTPNCYWKCIGDHMFVYTTREVQAGEELCFSYLDPQATFAVREETFSNWVGPGIGFSCQCDWCCLIRDLPALQKAEEVIQSTFLSVGKMILEDPVATAHTVEALLPEGVRAEYFKMFSQLPLKIQNLAAANLWILHGCCLLVIKRQPEAALEAFKEAVAIQNAVSDCSALYMSVDMFRIVGLSMACGNKAEAKNMLAELWHDKFGPSTSLDNPHVKFCDYTCMCALPWWQGSTSTTEKVAILRRMALEVSHPHKMSKK